MIPVLSVCCGMGLLDRAFLDAGFDVEPGCECDPEQVDLYRQLCGRVPPYEQFDMLLDVVRSKVISWDGIIGGPPCQPHSKLRAMRASKFQDLTPQVLELVEVTRPDWYLFENVVRIPIPGAKHVRLNAMNFYSPPQSRERWFTFSPNLTPPAPLIKGDVNTLCAYPVVAGRLYGPKRGALLQGYPAAARLNAPCHVLQKGLAEAVPYPLALAWALTIKSQIKGE